MPAVFAEASFWVFNVTSWTLLGLAGNVVFGMRFLVQWIASERRKMTVIPVSFWWLSIAGSVLQGTYFAFKKNPATGIADPDIVGILGFTLNMVIYVRNLQLIAKQKLAAGTPAGNIVSPDGAKQGKPE
jgi:lipid-A-disaccharide synthase-like uncharacterized protein